MIKILPVVIAALSITACQAQQNTQIQPVSPAVTAPPVPAPQPVQVEKSNGFPSADLQKCHAQIDTLKRFDRRQYNALHNKMAKIEKDQLSLSAS